MSNCLSATPQLVPTIVGGTAQDAFLLANSTVYQRLVSRTKRIDRRRNAEAVLGQVSLTAQFAANFHPGCFADGAVENLALEIGAERQELWANEGDFSLPVVTTQGYRRVLHVASRVVDIGGHTRTLYHWIQNDRGSIHSLIVINQGDCEIPNWLVEAVERSRGALVIFPPAERRHKACWLREAARRGADLVVLHHDAQDVVPTVAFAVRECPPVAVLNHADHQFWLGSSVVDIAINLRSAGSLHAAERRFVPRNTVLPIPLADRAEQILRDDARRMLGIPTEQIVLLSVGRGEKYRPCRQHDFIRTVGGILDRRPDTHLYVVGESRAGIAPYLRRDAHERIHFLGRMEDPSLFRAAADIYLESFPFGSNTALLEAALSGLPVVPAYAPLSPLLVAGNDSLNDLLQSPQTEEDYVRMADLLIEQPDYRLELGRKLRSRLLGTHVGQGWLDRLAAVYEETDRLTHNPRRIPVADCSASETDINLSFWHVMGDGKGCSAGDSADDVAEVVSHTALAAMCVGDFRIALGCAVTDIRRLPYRKRSWDLLTSLLISKAIATLRAFRRFARV